MDNKVLEFIDRHTLDKLHAAGFRIVKADSPTEKMMSALVAMVPDIYAQGSDTY